jgi:NADH:ubiquinone oxidoreductase subunit 6 (subunit J)
MHSLLALLGVFFCTAILYLIAGLAFVGVVFLIVYVGAVAVLFLFVIMLLNVKSLTSNEELIQHQSQILAIIFAAALLAQTFFTLGGAFDHLLAIGFLRDAILEATTSEAVSFYVRFQAADINSLTGLYTTHGILLLVTTIVLLVALLGAIILATVTTERALSISDLHPYPKKIVSRTAFLACTLFFLGAEVPNVFIDDFTALDTLDPILFTHYLRGAERDVKLRSLRRFKPDTYTLQSYRYSAQRYKYKPYREPLKFENIDFVLPESVSESDLSTSAERR